MNTGDESQKIHRDNHSVIQTAKQEGASEKALQPITYLS